VVVDGKIVNTDVGDVSCDECPVSYIRPRSRWLVLVLLENKMHTDAAGACLFGANTMDWPEWWSKAVALVEAQSLIVERACDGAR
jgi:hypothetical protein